MKKFLSVLIFGILIQTAVFSDDMMTVLCGDISVSSPLGWLVQYTGSPGLFVMYSPMEKGDTFQENGNLIIEALSVDYTVSDYMDASAAALQSAYTDFELLEKRDNFHIVKGKFGAIPVQQVQYFFIHENNAYILTFSSNPENFERYREVFSSIAGTFRFTGE